MADTLWSSMDADHQKREIARLDYEDYRTESSDRLKIQETLGLSTLRSLTLINGGAIIALFTFIGNVGQRSIGIDTRSVWWAFAWFVLGLVATVAAHGTSYLMQVYAYHTTVDQLWVAQSRSVGGDRPEDHDTKHAWSVRWERATIGLAVASLTLFVVGAAVALGGVLASA